jgi:hypothetical protein
MNIIAPLPASGQSIFTWLCRSFPHWWQRCHHRRMMIRMFFRIIAEEAGE